MADGAPEPFVHLHTHTEFSLLDGAARIGELVDTARAMGQPAIAITDHGVLYGAVDFYAQAKAAGIKPIIGCEMYMAPRSRHDRDARSDRDPSHLVLLAASDVGYRNLLRLVSTAHLEGHYYKPRIDKELLAQHSEGLICLSACLGGELPQSILRGDLGAAETIARQHAEIMGPDAYFLELQDHGIDEEAHVREGLVEIARRTGLPLVCTNDSHYIRPDDAEAHDILLCLQTGARREEEKRFKFSGRDFFVSDGAAMRARFAAYGEALGNTLRIAERCDVTLQLGRNLLPRYEPIPDGHDADSYLRELCEAGLRERYGDGIAQAHRERLAMELDVIRETGFSAYFLIVWDLIRAARCSEVRVGPGRGSAAGSIVSYVLRITDIDPLRYGLIFERFLNLERVQMPDIDIDFDDQRRDRVLHYVQDKYGHDRVAQIITFGTMAARAAIRDVGRVLNVPLPDVDRLAKLVPPVVNITLERALSESRELRELYEGEDWATRVIDNARRLEGIARNASTHAAGVVIGSEPLVGVVPLQRSTSGDGAAAVTQFDMNGVSRIGLLKIDFLGLSNLSVLDEAAEHVRRVRGIEFDLDALPLDDKATYELLSRADTHGVFQMEGTFAKRVLIDMQPESINDMAVANALNRPGPIEGGVPDMYMRRKRGEEPVEYLLPEMEASLAETYGTILYQDQVMQIASAVAGFSLGEADVLRAAMGKKDKAKMATQREKFLSGARGRGVAGEKAAEIFDLIAYFAGYGFNKCLDGDTTITDATTGERTSVRELCEHQRPFTVHALGSDGKLQARRVTHVLSNGRKPVLALKTATGRVIKATAEHRFRTFDGWMPLRDLKPGDSIAVARRLTVETEASWPEYKLITLAGLISEGNTCHPTCLYFYNRSKDLIDDFVGASTQFPATVARVYTRRAGMYEVCLNTGRDSRFYRGMRPWNAGTSALQLEDDPDLPARSGAFAWVQELGLLGRRAPEKSVPGAVFQLRDSNIALFLGRLWAGDGCIQAQNMASPSVFYATASPALARDVQALLQRLGMRSVVAEKRMRYRGQIRHGYTVRLAGEGCFEAFSRVIAPHCVGRENDVERLRSHIRSTCRDKHSSDLVPLAVRRLVDAERRERGMTWLQFASHTGVATREFHGLGSPLKKGFRRSTISRIAEAFDSDDLRAASSGEIQWDFVCSVELSGFTDTYDLTVDVDHNFVADGIVTHNSHAVSYGLIGYQTAYMKANHPLEYMCALLNSRAGDFDKLKLTILDAHARSLMVRPPDVNRSSGPFSIGDVESGEILYGLRHIKNVGERVADAIVEARAQGSAFDSLLDLCLRVNTRDLNRRVLEALIKSGACDALGERAAMLRSLDAVMDRASMIRRERESGQIALFGDAAGFAEPAQAEVVVMGTPVDPLTGSAGSPLGPAAADERLAWEREYLGMYLSDHPLRRVAAELQEKVDTSINELGPHLDGLIVQVGGAVRDVRSFVPRKSTTGQRMAFLQIEDLTGSCEVVVFARTFEECAEVLRPDAVVIVRGKVEANRPANGAAPPADDGERSDLEPAKILAEAVYAFDDDRLASWRRDSTVHIKLGAQHTATVAPLRHAIEQHHGDCPVVLHIQGPASLDDVTLPDEYNVVPGPGLERAVEALAGAGSYRVEIRRERAPERERRTAARTR